jgi:signal transduction histidine kinase
MPYAKQFLASYNIKEPMANDYVSCDKQRIEQVLTNFLSNAAKYGGDNDAIEVAVTRVGESLRVSVDDHGAGIPDDFRSRVFEKFAMAYAPKNERAINQDVKSSGLGLSIARAIIEEHGGSIGFDAKNDPQSDTGTTFWFELPVL